MHTKTVSLLPSGSRSELKTDDRRQLPDLARETLVGLLTGLKLTLIRNEIEASTAAQLINATSWPSGAPDEVTYRRNLLKLGHSIGTSQTQCMEALAAVNRILAEVRKPR